MNKLIEKSHILCYNLLCIIIYRYFYQYFDLYTIFRKELSMAKQTNNTEKNLKTAKSVAKKVVPKSAVKKAYKKSGFYRVVPYICIVLGLILAICFIKARFMGEGEDAGVLVYYPQLVLTGLLGSSAFLLPIVLAYLGVLWAGIHFKEATISRKRSDEERKKELDEDKKSTKLKTVLCSVFVLLLAVLLGSFSDPSSVDIAELFTSGSDSYVAGGVIGGAIGWLFNWALGGILIPAIILILGLTACFMFIIGITPDYIAQKIRLRREIRDEELGEDADRETLRYEKMRARELERAEKRKLRQAELEQKKTLEQEGNDEALAAVAGAAAASALGSASKNAPLEDDVDELLEGIGEDEPTLTPLNITPEANTVAAMATDFGGDPIIDGNSISAEELMKNIKPEADIALGEISSEELGEDLANVAPEEGESDVLEEIVTPYVFPPVDILSPNKNPIDTDITAELQENAKILMETLKSFKVNIKEVSYSRGPTITRYELKPEVGTRVRAIANLVDDIALSLATTGVRIEAPIPNKAAVGIEVPNRNRATVYLRDLIENSKFTDAKSKLTACLGMDVGGNPVYFDVSKMPHLLIAGTTGSGKSVCINTIILSILYKSRPDEVKLILVDPKQVEFTVYENIPHLYCPIVSEPKKAAGALASAVSEMERRFELIKEVGVRNIEAYNEAVANDPEKEYMPKMVIIIDELADLMMTARDEVETSICRLAQKARAAGIHVILGTQRPSVDVITGLIKANIPSRIACTVTSQVDSRTIIDVGGAENLIGYGDMLFAPVGSSKPTRVQGAFVSDGEVERIVSFIKENNSSVKYNKAFIESMEENAKNCGMGKKGASSQSDDFESSGDSGDSKFNDAVRLAIEQGKISTSLMQRKLGVGYGRAAKIIDRMEELGYVSAPDGTKPRRVLITMQEYMDRSASGELGEE